MKKPYKNQEGYLSIVALILIVIIGFLGSAIAYMFFGGALATSNFAQSDAAFYIAESGLENGTHLLLTPDLTTTNNRVACAALTGTASVTNSSFSLGTYTVTNVTTAPYNSTDTLSSNVLATDTTISVTSTSGFAPFGRILIDDEAINYAAISGNSFIGLTRGVNNTLASSHVTGAQVSQYQCSIDSQAGIPNLTSPYTIRELQQGVELQDAWVLGPVAGNDFVLTEWNRPNELAWKNQSFADINNHANLTAISMLSNAEGWAVGAVKGSNFTFIHLLGTTWTATPLSGACSTQNLTSISAVSSKEAWAVGADFPDTLCTLGSKRYTVMKWNGTTWTALSPTSTPSIPADGGNTTNLNGVSVIDTVGAGTGTIGFAVGNSGRILEYNGTSWTQAASPTANTLNSVFIVSSNEAWAVGANGVIIKWNGTTWSTFTSPTATTLNSIVMQSSNGSTAASGWAVGNSGVAIQYNGSSWASHNQGGGNLSAVAMFSANDAWATGTAGLVTHWNGSNWTSGTSNIAGTLTGIDIVAPGSKPYSAWQEVFP